MHGIQVDNQNHGPATLHVTTGRPFPGSPSVGAWIQYGLGSPNQDLPGYVVIQDPRGAPTNGAAVWSKGYLPAAHQGTLLRPNGTPIVDLARPSGVSAAQQRQDFDALAWLNQRHLTDHAGASELEARISAYELAFRMQTAAPELVDLSRRTGLDPVALRPGQPAHRRVWASMPVGQAFGRAGRALYHARPRRADWVA